MSAAFPPRPRPKDRYADGRESARVLLALANETLTLADIALRAAKDFDETRSLLNALRRQGKVHVVHRAWCPQVCRDGISRVFLCGFGISLHW
jgi:hypothetical protein